MEEQKQNNENSSQNYRVTGKNVLVRLMEPESTIKGFIIPAQYRKKNDRVKVIELGSLSHRHVGDELIISEGTGTKMAEHEYIIDEASILYECTGE